MLFIVDAIAGYAYIAVGLIARLRAPNSRTALLMLAVGFTWFIGNFRYAQVPVVPDVALALRDVRTCYWCPCCSRNRPVAWVPACTASLWPALPSRSG